MQLKNMLATLGITVLVTGFSMAPAAEPSADWKASANMGELTQVKDAWITMKIHSQFVPEDALEDSNIDVDSTNGVVTLSGTVANDAGRSRAVAIAKATDGVKGVTDKLKVSPPATAAPDAKSTAKAGGRRVTDGWIKSKIYAQFLTENALEDSDIDIDVRDGNVTLNGTVASDAGRTRAEAVAKATDGVKSVKNALKIAKTE
jgi:hyperosmotically inducible protein